MRNAKEIIQDAIDELEHHCGSSDCDCSNKDTENLIKELEELIETVVQPDYVPQFSSNNLQQLKAEIAAKMKQLHEYYQPSEKFSRDAVITMLRNLSAV